MNRFLRITMCALIAFSQARAQQTIQLYYEDFNGGTAGFTLNAAAGPSANTGPNQWIINNHYAGSAGYPNTPDQFQTISGTIAGAPNSNYLHVYDAGSSSTNACYNPNAPSDRMAVMNTSFCTLGLTDVELTFFYIGEGNANDYAQLYYSIDNGVTWIQTGQSKYYGYGQWKYEVVTDPAFNNKINLRFAFRWVNGSGAAPSIGFGVDDIIVVGTYDNVNNPVNISITSVSPNPVCKGSYLFIFWQLSAPLCTGTYEVELSNSVGNFASPVSLGVFTIPANMTSGGVAAMIPSWQANGTCYKVRINRVSPQPSITGIASGCFEIKNCPNIITTLQPVVTYGPDTVCVYSVIDVPFYSTGVYNFNNFYVAELSDMNGSFANPYFIGQSLDPNTYDPMLGSPPGTVSGIIPNVPPGCGYYVRVRSTSPVSIGSPWGPFCIRQCDVTTNNMQDISVCITDHVGKDTTIELDINTWNTNTTYNPGNQFKVQILSSKTFQILDTGSFGVVSATSSTTLTLSIPGLLDVISKLGPPGTGMYYMRIIATDPVPPWDSLATLVRLIIGSPDSLPPLVIPDDTLVCKGQISGITIFPYNYDSQYQWYSPNLNSGVPFFWEYNPLLINWANAPNGTYWFTVREYNYGCWGPWSDTVYITVIGTPSTSIFGMINACVGDTFTYKTTFLAGTYYDWSTSLGQIIDTANNQITIVFDSAGTAVISVFALNECGSNTGSKNVVVHPKPTVWLPPDTTICPGLPFVIQANSNATQFAWWANGTPAGNTNPITTYPSGPTTVVVEGKSQAGCKNYDTMQVAVFPEVVALANATDVSCYGEADGEIHVAGLQGQPPFSYLWDLTPPVTDSLLTGLGPGTYTVFITDANDCSDTLMVTITEPSELSVGTTFTNESSFGAKDGSATAQASGGTPPYSYEWNTNPPQTGTTATGLGPGEYIVTVTDANGCKISDTVVLKSVSNVFAIPNAFTPNGDGLNDIFLPSHVNVSEFEMKIFNRWGQLLFVSNDVATGWDGTYKGKPEEIGTYVYHIRARFLDGMTFERRGNVLLLR
ncbi:MAG: gliding motility-associated C-terminal domain-containing protein [Chitinophagales bacterium]|nr:gliding motility-associated C-terminal domain-containing protein [Chitinophagales bacterium]MDW8428717.1 gliding motility-associated C-terminal domain-containing protein [Chitinophagales bacterium]